MSTYKIDFFIVKQVEKLILTYILAHKGTRKNIFNF